MKMKALPAEVERDLVRRAQAGDLSARDELLEQFTPLMWRFAQRARTPQIEADELFQHCYLSFDKCVRLFDLKRDTPVRFITYLYTAISRNLKRSAVVTPLVCIPAGHASRVFSLEAAAEGDTSILSRLACRSAAKDVQWSEHRDEWRLVRRAINGLAPREKRIVKMRLKSLTLQDIGDRLGVTKERVRQLETRALKKIRATLNVTGPK